MTPTAEDFAAAWRLLDVGPPDKAMYYGGQLLPGAEKCVHPLSGSGNPLFAGLGSATMSDLVINNWRQHPYYHHEFMPNPGHLFGGHVYCSCNNSQGGAAHQGCWS